MISVDVVEYTIRMAYIRSNQPQTTENAMTENQAHMLADSLLTEFSLVGWRFKINTRAKNRLGCCKYGPRIIELSSWCLNGGVVEGKAEDTIRHEVAHIIAGSGAGHGPEWKRACRITGANPIARTSADLINEAPKERFKIVCDDCGKKLGVRHRRSDMRRKISNCCNSPVSFKYND